MRVCCVHCREATEVTAQSDLSRVLCSSCGGSFSLLGGETRQSGAEGARKLGRFELVEQVGAGTFGAVWKARDLELDRTVAVKMPRNGQLSPHEVEQFLREARAVAQLRHPHIVSVHEVGRVEGTTYIVSDFVQGPTLSEWLTAHRLSPRETASFCANIADALNHAHEKGVIHRDIKPSNVMLGPSTPSSIDGSSKGRLAAEATPNQMDYVPMLVDFGLARRITSEASTTVEGRVLGTPAYMSPEQARGEGHSADHRIDIYSLGVVLFKLLTDELPFRGNAQMLVVQILREDPPSPRKLNHRVPRDLEIICLKCLEKDPARRYQTGRELAEDLHRFLVGEPILARPVGWAERLWRWAQRRPAVAALILMSALAALALVGVGVGSIYHLRLRDAHERTRAAFYSESAARARAEQAQWEEQQQRRRAELFQYFHHIALAHAEWRDGSVGRVEPLLDECDATPRNWEWHYLKRLCHPELLTLRGHAGWVYNVSYSPDGTQIASTGADNSVRVWNASTGQLLMTLKGHGETSNGFAFSPDGTRIASTEQDHTIRFWHATRGEPMGSLSGAKGTVLTYSPDGKLLALLNADQQIEFWNLITCQCVRAIKIKGDISAFSPDGTRFLLTKSGELTAEVWDIAGDGNPRFTLRGHTRDVRNAAYSPDGRRIATCSYDQTIRLWDADTGRELHTLRGHTNEVTCVAFSPDAKRVASASMDQTVKVYDVATGQELLTFKGHAGGVHGVTFSPDGARLTSASLDQTVKVWDASLAPEAVTFVGQGRDFRYVNLAFDPSDSRLYLVGSDGTASAWDTETGQDLGGSKQSTYSEGVFSSDGKRLAIACADGSVSVLDANERMSDVVRPLLRLKLAKGVSHPLSFSADGSRLATISEEGVIAIADTASGQMIPTAELPLVPVTFGMGAFRQIGFSPDFTKAVVPESGGRARVWDIVAGQALAALEGSFAEDLPGLFAFSPDGSRIAGRTSSAVLAIWDAVTGKRVAILEGHYHLIMCLAFSPDGTRLASAGWDRTVKIWDTETGQEAITLRGHPLSVTGVAFSADGTRLATGSFDGTVKVWDARPWTPEAAAEHESLGLLRFFLAKPLCQADSIVYLQHFPMTHPQARDMISTLVHRVRDDTDPQHYHQAASSVVQRPYLNAFQYGFALKQAETACRLAPVEPRYRTTLGIAQYRAGNNAEAVSTLTEADNIQKDIPGNLAFLALAHHHMGQHEQAQATLARLQGILQSEEWADNEEAQDFRREAETVIQKALPGPATSRDSALR